MPKSFTLQSSFNNGVLDQSMRARFDTNQFYAGVEQGDNVKFLPQGGARKRPGFEYIATLAGEARIIPLVIDPNEYYILVFTNNLITVFDETDTQVDTIVTTYTTAQIFNVDYAQSGSDVLLVHEDHIPRIVSYDSLGNWSITNVTFVEQPQFDFQDSSSPASTAEVQRVVFSSVTAGATYKLTLEGIDTDEITYQDNADGAADIQDALIDLLNTPDQGIAVVRASSHNYDVTFSGVAAKDWRLITGRRTDAGSGSITSSETTQGVPSTEDTWSATRGWPRTVTFHEGRLWFGGSKTRTTTVWGSYVNSFFNFGFGRGRDDQGIEYTLNTDQNNKINAIYSSRTLQIFTEGGEFTIVQNEFDPITPSNVRILSQTRYGAKKVKPVDIEGVVTFVQLTGKAIREMFTESQGMAQVYTAPSISYLAPSLIVDPVQLETLRGTSAEDANYIIAVNSDGNLAVFNTLRDQNVSAWSLWKTDGDFTSIAVAVVDMYTVVKRTVNSATVYYLEKANDDLNTDSSKVFTSPGSTTLSVNHLIGESVKVKADDAVLSDETVNGSGNITIDQSGNSVEVGLPYTVTLKTMPISQNAGAGFDLDNEMRITRCTVEMLNSLGVNINGVRVGPYPLYDRQMGDAMDTPPQPFTGRKQLPILGWSKTNQITITQDDPVPMTILALGLEVDG